MSLLTTHVESAVHAGSECALNALSVIKETVSAVNVTAIKDTISTVDMKIVKDAISSGDMKTITVIGAQKAVNSAGQAYHWVMQNPTSAVGYAVALLGAGAVVNPVLVSVPMLSSVGSGSGIGSSIAPGSIAATIHSYIGSAVAGSLFSTLQSAGAGGHGLSVVNGIVQAGGGLVAAGTGVATWLKAKFEMGHESAAT